LYLSTLVLIDRNLMFNSIFFNITYWRGTRLMPEISTLPDILKTIAPQRSSNLLLAMCEHLLVSEETTHYKQVVQ
jgi:hypothetical protein